MKNKYSMTVEENIFVVRRNLADYIWKSVYHAGIEVSYPKVSVICDGISVDGMKLNEIDIIINLKNTWYFILENLEKTVTFNEIVKINNLLFERGTSSVQKIDLERKKEVEKNIKNATDRALTLMLYLMKEKLFCAGNKRTAMMVANKIMIKNGCGIISIPIQLQKNFDVELCNYSKNNKIEKIKSFLYENCIDGIHFR